MISGSVRPGNYTSMALNVIASEFASRPHIHIDRIHPENMKLPFPGQTGTFDDQQVLQEVVARASAVVLATPEYHGSMSGYMKLIIENLGFPSLLKGKPVALVGVASGSIGAIKSLEHLRSICSHVGAFALPSPVSIADVRHKFSPEGECLDAPTEKLLRGLADKVIDYMNDYVCPKFALEALVRGQIEESMAG